MNFLTAGAAAETFTGTMDLHQTIMIKWGRLVLGNEASNGEIRTMALKQSILITLRAAAMLVGASLVGAMLAGCAGSATPAVYNIDPTRTLGLVSPTTTQPAIPTRQPGCTVRTRISPNPTVESLLSPVADTDWTQGRSDASVTIIEYSDFQ
jgi:hypothetical protein